MSKQVLYLDVASEALRDRLGLPDDVEIIGAVDSGKPATVRLLIETPDHHIKSRTVSAEYTGKDGAFSGFRN